MLVCMAALCSELPEALQVADETPISIGPRMRSFAQLTPEERARRWRRLALGSTLGGVFVSVFALVLGSALGVVVTALMVESVADTWYLDRRVHRAGSLVKGRRPA